MYVCICILMHLLLFVTSFRRSKLDVNMSFLEEMATEEVMSISRPPEQYPMVEVQNYGGCYTHTHTHINTNTHKYTHTHTHTHTHIHTNHTYKHMLTHKHTAALDQTWSLLRHTHIRTRVMY